MAQRRCSTIGISYLAKGEIRSQLILAINVNDVVNGVLFAQKWQAYNKHFRSLLVVIPDIPHLI